MMDKRSRPYDVIVFGATGFTGRLVAEHLISTYGLDGELRWGIAGRDYGKLEAVRTALFASGARGSIGSLPLLHADAKSKSSVAELVRQTRVVCTTVGPYAKYGSLLVAACAEAGTDYCDLAGEPQWMRQMIDQHHDTAVRTGARIVSSCGFDSIPSDLGVWFLERHARDTTGAPCARVALRVEQMSGGTSGGTIASMLSTMTAAKKDPEVARVLKDPYGLNPKGQRCGPDGPDSTASRFDEDLNAWLSPFVMAGINTRIVRRSNALLGYPYGENFRYEEATLVGPGPKGWLEAKAASFGWTTLGLALSIAPGFLARFLPRPGQGPSKEKREAGSFSLLLVGHSVRDRLLKVRVTGDRDPGYGSTSKMLGQSAVCLAQDLSDELGGGFWTPASAMAEPLFRRLVDNAGLKFEVLSEPRLTGHD